MKSAIKIKNFTHTFTQASCSIDNDFVIEKLETFNDQDEFDYNVEGYQITRKDRHSGEVTSLGTYHSSLLGMENKN